MDAAFLAMKLSDIFSIEAVGVSFRALTREMALTTKSCSRRQTRSRVRAHNAVYIVHVFFQSSQQAFGEAAVAVFPPHNELSNPTDCLAFPRPAAGESISSKYSVNSHTDIRGLGINRVDWKVLGP